MKYFLDTEFSERGPEHPVILISIALVAEDGREFYAIHSEISPDDCNDWVKSNVLPHLELDNGWDRRAALDEIESQLLAFVDLDKYGEPEFWGYYADYDWVVLCQIFGTIVNLPNGWPMYCNDIKQFAMNVGNPKLPKHDGVEHHALADARWNKAAYECLDKYSLVSGAFRIAAERQRQISVEGWTQEHDDTHTRGELAEAASCYVDLAAFQAVGVATDMRRPLGWPPDWEGEWWKPSPDPIRNLEKAGALIAAEIDRLHRKQHGR